MKKLLLVLFSLVPVLAFADQHSAAPEQGYVPDRETAIAIAVAVWTPLYGKDKIESQKPYNATLNGNVWTIEGSRTTQAPGGVAVIEINKNDGKIIRVSHGK